MKNIVFSVLFLLLSAGLLIGSWLHVLPFSITEDLGFITGAACVWLTVLENIWNWPISILNSIFFLILFLEAHLFADSSLQVVYIVLGILGWYWWLKGGNNKTELSISKTTRLEYVTLTLLGLLSTFLMERYLIGIHDSAPFWDAVTTVLSLIAQYLLTKKRLENWYIWIIADVIYIALYASRNLYLTSVLYFIFLVMCIFGLKEWKKRFSKLL